MEDTQEVHTVGIVGLGLIGGSFAKAYHAAGWRVLAFDIDADTMAVASIDETIQATLEPGNVGECDLILLALYPAGCIAWLKENAERVRRDCLVIDTAGVKREVCAGCMPIAAEHGFTFVGGHPMAGTQFSGFANSKADMFDGAPMVVVPPQADDILLLDRVKKLLTPAGFAHLTVTTAEHHDEMIAYTSQMCHVISNAYVKSPRAQMHKGYSAGSYMDLTRVAWLNEHMWTDLFLENRTFLLQELDQMIGSLQEYREALEQGNGDRLCTLLAEGRICKEKVDGQ